MRDGTLIDSGVCHSAVTFTWLRCAKMDKRIGFLFEVKTLGDQRNIALDGPGAASGVTSSSAPPCRKLLEGSSAGKFFCKVICCFTAFK